MSLATGTRLGRYEIRSQIGAGGMGEVYLAQDTKLDRKVALTQYVIPSFIGAIYGAMGEKDKAFAELDKSIEQHDSWFKWAKVEPLFDPIRDDPRFAGLLKRMNLPQ